LTRGSPSGICSLRLAIGTAQQKGIEPAMTEHSDSTALPGDNPPTWRWLLAHFEEIVTAILLAVMLGSVGVSVFCRFVLKQPLSWTEEVILVCMVWMCFLGSSIATKHNEHIFIDFVVALVPRRLARVMEITSMTLVTGVLIVLIWQGALLVERTQEVTTIALGIPTMYMYAAIPFSAVLMLIHNLRNLAAAIRGWV
jgi:TRAP-type C4-dicarboxylate transport system permease small subunit